MLENLFLNILHSVSESRYWLGPLLLVDGCILVILTIKEAMKNEE